jgi:hypothetical protein
MQLQLSFVNKKNSSIHLIKKKTNLLSLTPILRLFKSFYLKLTECINTLMSPIK